MKIDSGFNEDSSGGDRVTLNYSRIDVRCVRKGLQGSLKTGLQIGLKRWD